MKVIVRRSIGASLIMILSAIVLSLVSIAAVYSFFTDEKPIFSVGTVLLLVAATVFMIVFIIRDTNFDIKLISYNKKTDELYLHPEKTTIHLKDIEDISYSNDKSNRGFHEEYLSGSLSITANNNVYQYADVSLIEDAAQKLGMLVYEYRQAHKNKQGK